ncbi:MAG: fenitrothion hydrolase [Actinobacteria bacterium]|nr:fenitrothion hydrolase [Actinomycetota bacterium]
MSTLARGIGGIKDLPVPGWLFFYGAALVLIVSFVALAVLWKEPRLERGRHGRALPPGLQRLLLSPVLHGATKTLSFGLLLVVGLAATLGEPSAQQNFAPTFVFVVFWLGLVPVVALLGNVWPALNPWRAPADAVAWAWARAGRSWEPMARYPERLGCWPATLLLLAFTAYELAYPEPASPRALALAIYLYSAVTWYGMLWFGREEWTRSGEAFSVYFGLLSRVAPFGTRGGDGAREIVIRPPLSGLARGAARPGTFAFVAVMLGSVAFDGLSRTPFWLDRRFDVATAAGASQLGRDVAGALFNLAGLVFVVGLVALAYAVAVAGARAFAHVERPLVDAFLASLIPIALAYVVAHYFSLLVLQGQVAIRLASDPLGRDWDLFGTAGFDPDFTVLSPNLVWYVQVAALVIGHVAGLVVAHTVRSRSSAAPPRPSGRSTRCSS